MKHLYSKKTFRIAGAFCSAIVLLISCKKSVSDVQAPEETTSQLSRKCGAMEALQNDLAADPTLQQRMQQIEAFTQRYIAQRTEGGPASTTTALPATITIPVVVNVLYNTAVQNISDAQIQSQIDVLNEDYNRLNKDSANTPAPFRTAAANVGIKFTLYKTVRQSTTTTSWTNNDAMKSTRTGGIAPTNATTMLNIWVCNLSGGLLGYAKFPGGTSSIDGVVIHYSTFGRTGTLAARYNLGRTTTHEVGHWMNLKHIWGDATCGDDLVSDTPTQDAASNGIPAYPSYSTCTGNPAKMTMDFMDYTDDAGMNLFTQGQKTRIRACFASGGPRAAYYQ